MQTHAALAPLKIRRKLAYLIGNNAYTRPIPRLLSPIRDTRALGQALQQDLGYEIRLLPNATRADLVRLFRDIITTAAMDDSVLVYYAGHGYEMAAPATAALTAGVPAVGPPGSAVGERSRENRQENSQENRRQQRHGYWIPVDASPDDAAGWISNDDIARFLARIRARQLILISDSCYSGRLASEQRLEPAVQTATRDDILRRRTVAVMSSGGDEPVTDKGKAGHSIFAWSLLAELGRIDGAEYGRTLFDQVRTRVLAEYPQDPQYGAMASAGHMPGGDYLLEPGEEKSATDAGH